MTQAACGGAIVTGGAYGIGRAAAVALAEDGWPVLIVDRDREKVREVCDLVRAASGVAEHMIGDVSDPACAAAAVSLTQSAFGGVGGLVNCAAVRVAGTITAISFEQWRLAFKVGLDGVFHFCKAAIPAMAAQGGGSIVNISSPSAFGRGGLVAYSSVKAAVNTLSACLAADHAADGIRVNVVIPGFTQTGMTESYPAEKIAAAVAGTPAKRPAQPEEIAMLIRFLMSPAGASFTGGQFGQCSAPIILK